MRLSIFSRLIVGYLAIFLLVTAAAIYVIVQLYRLNTVTQSLLTADKRIIESTERLADVLLSQVRFDRKFTLTGDDAFRRQFLLAQRDFGEFLRQARGFANSPHAETLLRQTKQHHDRYEQMFNEEATYVKAGQPYDRNRYRAEKERALDEAFADLKRLKAYGEAGISNQLRRLDQLGANALRAAIVLTATSLVLGILISLVITRDITRPIYAIKNKTRQIAEGNFQADLSVSSPPEITDLATAINFMCDRLRQLDKMKSDFFATMSHELRTPLASIKEGIGLLREQKGGSVTDRQQTILGILVDESNRLIGLVNSLLDLSKMEAGMMAYNVGPMKLAPLIDAVMIELAPLADAKRITLEAETKEELPLVRIDHERILQVVRNLIGNAIKFTPEGGRVTVLARPVDEGAEVSVMDTGPGIPEQSLVSVFEKFTQVNSAGSNGTGLGLAIAKQIVISHGGAIWVQSSPGQGSIFTFVLPA